MKGLLYGYILNDWPGMRTAIVDMLRECAQRFGHDDANIRFVCEEALRPVEPEDVRMRLVEQCLALYYES